MYISDSKSPANLLDTSYSAISNEILDTDDVWSQPRTACSSSIWLYDAYNSRWLVFQQATVMTLRCPPFSASTPVLIW